MHKAGTNNTQYKYYKKVSTLTLDQDFNNAYEIHCMHCVGRSVSQSVVVLVAALSAQSEPASVTFNKP